MKQPEAAEDKLMTLVDKRGPELALVDSLCCQGWEGSNPHMTMLADTPVEDKVGALLQAEEQAGFVAWRIPEVVRRK